MGSRTRRATTHPGWAQELHTALGDAVPQDATALEVTATLTGEVIRWAKDNGWSATTEVPIGIDRFSRGGVRTGRIDVVVQRSGRPVAIELDRGIKKWSLTKLMWAAEAGHDAVWVRWGAPCTRVAVPDPVILLPMLVRYRRPQEPDLRAWYPADYDA